MAQIKTNSGFELDFDPEILDDIELFELIIEVDRGDAGKIFDIIKRCFTPEQKAALYDHCRLESGRVPMSTIEKEIEDIFNAIKDPGKK